MSEQPRTGELRHVEATFLLSIRFSTRTTVEPADAARVFLSSAEDRVELDLWSILNDADVSASTARLLSAREVEPHV